MWTCTRRPSSRRAAHATLRRRTSLQTGRWNGRGVCGFRASIALVKFCFIFGPNDAEQKTPGFACYNFFLRAKNYRTHTTRAKNYRTHTTRVKNYRTNGHAHRTQNSRNAEGFWCASQQGTLAPACSHERSPTTAETLG